MLNFVASAKTELNASTRIFQHQRAADRAARAAGTVYRVVAGTESLTTALETDDSNDDGHSTSSSATSHSHSPVIRPFN